VTIIQKEAKSTNLAAPQTWIRKQSKHRSWAPVHPHDRRGMRWMGRPSLSVHRLILGRRGEPGDHTLTARQDRMWRQPRVAPCQGHVRQGMIGRHARGPSPCALGDVTPSGRGRDPLVARAVSPQTCGVSFAAGAAGAGSSRAFHQESANAEISSLSVVFPLNKPWRSWITSNLFESGHLIHSCSWPQQFHLC
jgi:hypothetical protein